MKRKLICSSIFCFFFFCAFSFASVLLVVTVSEVHDFFGLFVLFGFSFFLGLISSSCSLLSFILLVSDQLLFPFIFSSPNVAENKSSGTHSGFSFRFLRNLLNLFANFDSSASFSTKQQQKLNEC